MTVSSKQIYDKADLFSAVEKLSEVRISTHRHKVRIEVRYFGGQIQQSEMSLPDLARLISNGLRAEEEPQP